MDIRGGRTLYDLDVEKFWLHSPPPTIHSVPLATSLPKRQLQNRLRTGAVTGRIYQNRPALACYDNLALYDIEYSHPSLFRIDIRPTLLQPQAYNTF